MLSGTFSARAYAFFDTLLWIAGLNLLWIAFTLVGAGVLGAGPATAAAHIVVRRRIAGDGAPLLRGFTSAYFRNFARANLLSIPVTAATVALVLNWNYFAGGGGFAQYMAAAVLVAAIFMAGTVCYLFPMYARYELALPQYLLMSSRFAVRHLAGTVILLFVSAAVVYASSCLPGLVPFFSIGAWLYLTGWLCDRFFAANDRSVAIAAGPAPGSPLHGASTA
ncbi:YesL family protein [Pseudarthrobacter sp. NPDC058119]|uniref:YesL family protein n=1 Tax=Pseudarthrobacter sp. NPDC058119 TaxID=3346348 RepID=UPI0036D79614